MFFPELISEFRNLFNPFSHDFTFLICYLILWFFNDFSHYCHKYLHNNETSSKNHFIINKIYLKFPILIFIILSIKYTFSF